MRCVFCVCAWIVLRSAVLQAALTPLDERLIEGRAIDIECLYQYTHAEAAKLGSYEPSESPTKAPYKGICRYKLYVPPGYYKNADKKYPVVFVASAKGDPFMDNIEARAGRDGWIVVLLTDTMEKDPLWLGNFIGAHDDVVKRVRVIDDFKVATGSKGGGCMSSVYGVFRPGFKAYIGQGSCFWSDAANHRYDAAQVNKEFAVYQVLGNSHVSFRCRQSVKSGLPPDTFHMLECVKAGETWAPADSMERAFEWIERKVFIDSRTLKLSTDAVMWHYDNKMRALEQTASLFVRYELMEYIVALAKRHDLLTDKALKEKVQGFEKEMLVLAKDEAVKKELSARLQFWAISQNDNRRLADHKKADGLVQAFRALARQYEGTVYAQKAALRAESLRIDYIP